MMLRDGVAGYCIRLAALSLAVGIAATGALVWALWPTLIHAKQLDICLCGV